MLSARSHMSWLRETLAQNFSATVSCVILAICTHHVMVFRGRANFPENFVFLIRTFWFGVGFGKLGRSMKLGRFGQEIGKAGFPGEATLGASTAKVSLAGNVSVRFFRSTRLLRSFRQCWAQKGIFLSKNL